MTRSEEPLDRVRTAGALALQADASDPPTLASAMEHARRELESLDAVVNAGSASRPFATEEDMTAGATAFNAMDASETPGTRTSVDMCEIKLEQEPS